MSYYILTIPVWYLLIIGTEYVFWRQRFDQIKHQIPINLFVLTVIAGFLGSAIWFQRHFEICWKQAS